MSTGSEIVDISDMIDRSYPRHLDSEAHLWRRLMKISEENGEVTEALFGALGENPRKGTTHTMDDVRKELFDVALAALGAVAHIDQGNPLFDFEEHVTRVRDRLREAIGL